MGNLRVNCIYAQLKLGLLNYASYLIWPPLAWPEGGMQDGQGMGKVHLEEVGQYIALACADVLYF